MHPLLHRVLRLASLAFYAGFVTAVAADAPALVEQPKATAYRIQPTDMLNISFSGEPDLNVAKKVDSNGNLSLQLLSTDVHVASLTQKEAQAAIETAYKEGRILRNPQVFVTVEWYAPREITVGGYVKSPGKVQILPETVLTLKEAIIKCGNLSDTANGRKVTVTRTLPDGTSQIFEKDVENALLGKKGANLADANFVLEPGDYVYVKERVI